MSLLTGGNFQNLIMGSIKTGITSAMPMFITIITYFILFVTYPATPFIFVLSILLKQLKFMFYAQRQL
jgi:hypothetical protein